MTGGKRSGAARRAGAAFAARGPALAGAPGARNARRIVSTLAIAAVTRAAGGALAACASAIAFASGAAAPGALDAVRAAHPASSLSPARTPGAGGAAHVKPVQEALRAKAASPSPSLLPSPPSPTTSLLPGAPPQRVVATIGRGTPQVASKVDPTAAAFHPDPALAGPRVPQGSRPGHFSRRNAPSLLYVRYVPRRHFYQDDDALAPAPFGGLFSDGRADTLAEQLRGPLFDPDEMNNASPAALTRKIGGTALGAALAERFGPSVRRDPERMVRALGEAMQAYLQSDEMAPFSSRYDAYVMQRAPLTPQEKRGLALFRNPDKGNCMSCHTLSDTASRPERSLFTDFGYDAIAVPRNRALRANRDPRHFDNGLCDTAAKLRWPEPAQWCGYLRTPGLRNVAIKESFMHNGVFDTLRDAVAFYNTRSTDPKRWYHGRDTFDDVPAAYRGNINVNSTPMNRRAGTPPAMTDADVDDIVAFLRTLTDARYVGLMPAAPDGKAARP
ncbi:di-heme cytochrome c peroxidase family protein [Burkholderia pseudomallei]|nr:di-heme cytochrome c peroxidase family protein [Burkholderia pseudomallei]CAJ4442541.1 di-heme cytochrome c peroxidase family protein [Burkholderia pseudomallei]CAJ5958964.1 di-heme cytochrome c peroxidase family protein [Burkholderia pseudomallei]CAJ6475135.1 di-heme cytochrome c peroxidase family protein [Burkholderia pseudomallei]